MGTRWGINRTVAQVHALLFISEKPLAADEIVETLSVARSNISTSLKELQGWGIVRVVHVLGDRRDHFESIRDVWEMFRVIVEERKRREIDPTLLLLRECVAQAEKPGAAGNATTKQRLGGTAQFFRDHGRLVHPDEQSAHNSAAESGQARRQSIQTARRPAPDDFFLQPYFCFLLK